MVGSQMIDQMMGLEKRYRKPKISTADFVSNLTGYQPWLTFPSFAKLLPIIYTLMDAWIQS